MSFHTPQQADLAISRRWLLRGLLTGGALALGGGVALLGGRERRVLTASRALMGTTATILITGADPIRADAAATAAFARMEAVARRMTRYDRDSDVGRVNAERRRPVAVHPTTAHVVQAALDVARASDGAFDPALDKLSTVWGFHGGVPLHVPGAGRLRPWQGGGLYRTVRLGGAPAAPTVQLMDPYAGLDLGGIAKGYAVDVAALELRRRGIRHAVVEAGGDLLAMGRAPDGGPWPIGVRHPRDPARLLATLRLSDEAAATSGDDSQYFEAGGRRYSHLMEPSRAQPASYVQSITVRAGSAMVADALATAAGVMPPEPAERLLRRLGAHGWQALDGNARLLQG